ncbi:MAG: nucleoside 2-deoxyribosyltransferase, partial [Candidatus Binataceae bacterium]|nr:nucleoside 2-deoxyribosyltransferase [Candidatus Binataceae bacterium]
MKPRVYLAGPIAGLSYDDAVDWRAQASHDLATRGIEALSPMRAKHALEERRISTNFRDYAGSGPFYTSRGIMTRDFNDVKRSDALLVNLLGLRKQTTDTVMELGWAFALQKPTVVVIEPTGNVHDNHPLIAETFDFRVATMEEAIDAVAVILNR